MQSLKIPDLHSLTNPSHIESCEQGVSSQQSTLTLVLKMYLLLLFISHGDTTGNIRVIINTFILEGTIFT